MTRDVEEHPRSTLRPSSSIRGSHIAGIAGTGLTDPNNLRTRILTAAQHRNYEMEPWTITKSSQVDINFNPTILLQKASTDSVHEFQHTRWTATSDEPTRSLVEPFTTARGTSGING